MSSYIGVIPVHNGARTIYEALSSLANQTIPPEKILVFDNSSNDSTLQEVKKFKKSSHIPVVVEQSASFLSPNESFESSIKNVEGRFIWLAADDMLFPWSAEKMLGTRCGVNCKHSLSGFSLYLNDKAEIVKGKIVAKNVDTKSFLRDPADCPITYGMHVASEVREYFPKAHFHAWDWNFSFFCIKSGIHIVTPFPTHFREYTPITSHRASASSQEGLKKYFPYIELTKSIFSAISFKEKLQIFYSVVLLNIKGFIVFGKFSEVFAQWDIYSKVTKTWRLAHRPVHFAKNNLLIRRIYKILPKLLQNLLLKLVLPSQGELVVNDDLMSRLVDESGSSHRARLLSISNPIKDFYCVPTKRITSAQIIEMSRFFLKFADTNSKLVIDPSNTSVNLDFINTVILGLKRIYKKGEVVLEPIRKKSDQIHDIDNFYAKIWALDFDTDIDSVFSEIKIQKNTKKRKVNFFLPEIPQPNRDAGSIDALYILSILKKLGVTTNIYLPHFVSTNSIALATLKEYANLELVENFRDDKDLNLIYGPYSYQNFAPYSLDHDFVYIMVDAVFRRATQNKNKLSLSDRTILQYESEALQNCKFALSISETDQIAVIERFPATNTLLFPIIRFARYLNKRISPPPDKLLFIGSMVHTPNKIAADWLVKELAPQLLLKNPEIRLVLAGQGTEEFNRAHSNVSGLGMVSDLNSLYADSFATVAPMAVAAGINGKVIESLCYQTPPIISEAVSANMPKSLLEYCEIAMNLEEYSNFADRLFKNPKTNKELVYALKQVNGKSNIVTLIDLLKGR